MSLQATHRVADSSAALGMLFLLGPLSGLAVEMALAWVFGASRTVDAYRVASIAIVFSSQIAFGLVLPTVAVPIFNEYRVRGGHRAAWRFAFFLVEFSAVVAVLGAIVAFVFAGEIVSFLAPGLGRDAGAIAATLFRSFAPAGAAVAVCGAGNGILHANRVFFLAPVSQLLLNLGLFLGIAFLGTSLGHQGPAVGALAGGAAIAVVCVAVMGRVRRDKDGRGTESRETVGRRPMAGRLFRMAVPLLVVVILSQWSVVIVYRVLSGLGAGSLANFGYAWRMLSPVILLPSALATVAYPLVSWAVETKNRSGGVRISGSAIRMTVVLAAALSTVLFSARRPLVALLYGRGAMSAGDVESVASLFGIVLAGAPATALWLLLQRIAFAHRDTGPAMGFGALLAFLMTGCVYAGAALGGVPGVAWATNTATWLAALGLLCFQIRRHGVLPVGEAGVLAGKVLVPTGMVLAVGLLLPAASPDSSPLTLLGSVAARCGLALAIWFAVSRASGLAEEARITAYLKWKAARILGSSGCGPAGGVGLPTRTHRKEVA